MLFTLSVSRNWHVEQLDIKTAFLHGEIDRPKYVSVPEGVNLDKTKVMLKLQKALYGLSIAPKCWFMTLNKVLKDSGFESNFHEPCLHKKEQDSKIILILVYVDDLLITGSCEKLIQGNVDMLKFTF